MCCDMGGTCWSLQRLQCSGLVSLKQGFQLSAPVTTQALRVEGWIKKKGLEEMSLWRAELRLTSPKQPATSNTYPFRTPPKEEVNSV